MIVGGRAGNGQDDARARPWGRLSRCRSSPNAAHGRHRVHVDNAVLEEWSGGDAEHQIDIGMPRLIVDTTDGYVPDLERITAFARGATVPDR